VLRLGPGDPIRVFDGRGHEWDASVEEVSRGRASVRLGTPVDRVREAGVSITLAAAVLKADHMDAVVRDAVMLGAAAILPLLTEHTEVTARVIERGGRIARWRRIAIASAKQCGRAVVPPVHEAMPIADALTTPMGTARIMLAEPAAGGAGTLSLSQVPRAPAAELFIGPEGGWTPGELQLAAASGCMLVTLGAHTLRAAAAPIVAMAALRAIWGDL
jgi:16S rRNA (uracil1498-N3)-methyltransferase